DVRVRRNTADHTPGNYDSGQEAQVDNTYWTALRSVSYSPPFGLDNVYLVALRIKASGQLNGVLDTFNFIAQAKLPVYQESAGWSADTATRNPAWAYAQVLRGLPYGRKIDDADINGDDLLTWANNCTTNGFYYDKVVDSKTTVGRMLDEIAAAGRATKAWRDGKHTIVEDITHSTPVQGFSPRNSWDFKAEKVFVDLPHALVCRFISEDAEYQWDERIVYDDGYSEDGADSADEIATVFETMDFPGIVDPDHIWKLARYFFATARLRPETYQVNADVEHIVALRGEMVRLRHDVMKVGLGQARIKAIGTLGSNVIANGDMELDSEWSHTGAGTDEQSTEQKYEGNYSWKVSIPGSPGGIVSSTFTTVTGITYRHVFWIYPLTYASIFVVVKRGSDGTTNIYALSHSLTLNAWNKVEFEVTETIGGSSGKILFWATNPNTFYIDDVSCKPITAANMVTVDDTLTMESGKTYAVQIRKSTGLWLDTTVTLDVGDQTEIELASISGISVGELLFFGESGSVSSDVIITAIDQGPDLTARITMVDYNAAILTADGGSIPSYNPNITEPPSINRTPPVPTIESVVMRTDRTTISDIKVTQIHAVVNFSLGITTDIDPHFFQFQYREISDDSVVVESPWVTAPNVPVEDRNLEIPVEDGFIYDFRIRAISKFGIESAWSAEYEYTVTYQATVPNDIGSLSLAQGGSTWEGHDCVVKWNVPVDFWRVAKYQINIYRTSPLALLRTETIDVGLSAAEGGEGLLLESGGGGFLILEDSGTLLLESSGAVFYSYRRSDNEEDNNGTPISGLTFRVWAISKANEASDSYAELAVTHSTPSAVTSLAGTAFRGGVLFKWDANTDPSFSYFLYRVRVDNDSLSSWTSWLRTADNSSRYQMTALDVSTWGAGATIYIEVKAVDIIGTEGATSSSNNAAGSINISETDIDDFAITASKIFTKIPVLHGLTLTNNSPSAGYVAWNAHKVYYNGVEYDINAGNTNSYYIYWKDLAGAGSAGGTYSASNDHPGDNEATWKPGEDFIIAINDSGSAQEAWNAIANQVIGSAFIMNAAINDAQVNTLSGTKIDATTSISIGAASTWQSDGIQLQYNGGNPRFYAGDGSSKYIQFDGADLTLGSQVSFGIKSTTWQTDGIQLQYNAGNPRAYIGDGASKYIQFDGADLTLGSQVSFGINSAVFGNDGIQLQYN
ncbi:MAG: hypothetical protein DRQ47_06765, partial [Gammaproteobacteria bacterium]